MQTHTHTKGPWIASHNGNDDIRIFAESVADSPRCVAKVNSPLYRQLEASANARLIAAAPDLLAELHAVRVQLEAQAAGYTALEIWPHVRAESIRRISMTIHKAEGNA